MEIFKNRKEQTLEALEAHLVKTSYPAGTKLYSRGELGTELFFIRRGLVGNMLPLNGDRFRRINTCGRGSFVGELAFLDGDTHSTDAIALTDVDVFVLSRKNLDAFAEVHKKAALNLMEGLASIVTNRVRFLTAELVSMES